MLDHQPRTVPVIVAATSINGLGSFVQLTFNTSYPPGSMFLVAIQGAQTSANATGVSILGNGDEIIINSAGPFSFDGSTASYIRWICWRSPSGYINGSNVIFVGSGTTVWPATSFATIVYLQGCTQFLGYSTASFTTVANTTYSSTLALGAGTILSNAYRTSTVELAFTTNAVAAAWNGVGNPGITPDAGSWTQITNAGGTGLGVSNWWANFTQRPPATMGINGRYTTVVNTHMTFFRFGG